MRPLFLLIFVPILFITLDSFLTIFSFGFYRNSFQFDASLIGQFISLKLGYTFATSPLDFLLLLIFRSLLILTGLVVVLWTKRSTPSCSLFFFGVEIFNWGFTLTKLLAFSEGPSQLAFLGIWFSLVWNVISCVLLWVIWYMIFCSNAIASFEAITRHFSTIDGDREQLIQPNNQTEAEETEKKQARLPTLAHIGKILYYCKAQWHWYAIGLVFLIIFAFGKFLKNWI